jgi:hypothetical protein
MKKPASFTQKTSKVYKILPYLVLFGCTQKKSSIKTENIDGSCWELNIASSERSDRLQVTTKDYYRDSLAAVMLCRTGKLGPRYGKNCDVTATSVSKEKCGVSEIATLTTAAKPNQPSKNLDYTSYLQAHQPQLPGNTVPTDSIYEYPQGKSLQRDSLCMSYHYAGSQGELKIEVLSREEHDLKRKDACPECQLIEFRIFLKENCAREGK